MEIAMKKTCALLLLLLVACEKDNMPLQPNSTGTIKIVIQTGNENEQSLTDSTSVKAQAAKPTRLSQLEIRILRADNSVLTSKQYAPSNGYFHASINVEAQDNLKLLCIGTFSGVVGYFGIDEDVDVQAGKTTTAIIEGWNDPYLTEIGEITPNPSIDGNYTISWTEALNATVYNLQEASNNIFAGASTVYSGSNLQHIISGKLYGTFYYRVQASNVYNVTSSWSNIDSVTVQATQVIIPVDITMVSISGGSFSMGSISGSSDEKPVHTVTVSYFEMSIYEITQNQYQTVIGSNPSNSYGVGDNYPVYYVSRYNAVMFCNSLSEAAGFDRCYNESTGECDFSKNGYRLPTEAEWEYACRAGTETNYYTGDSESDLARAGWYNSNSGSMSHQVGQKEPNTWGLYDMHGNVREWCNDWFGSYGNVSVTDPTGAETGPARLGRGGSWADGVVDCRSTSRYANHPDGWAKDFGFRVVRRPYTQNNFSISGTVIGSDGVSVSLSGNTTDSQTINNGGSYSFTVTEGGTFIVTPSKAGYTFTPESMTFSNVISNQEQNFICIPLQIPMVRIPAGSFQMGNIHDDLSSIDRPVHDVILSSFEMGIYEVTQEQYNAIIGVNPSEFNGTNLPVEQVSWYDAATFCNRLSDEEGLDRCYNENSWVCDFTKNGFRLPTEAEWEYACSAGTTTRYYTGDSENDLSNAGWYIGNSDLKTHPVGQKEPNAYGLYDMHGNVMELCNDWFGSYSNESVTNPSGPTSGTARIYRGGSWHGIDLDCLSARRLFNPPSYTYSFLGFRVVRSPGGVTY